MQALVAGVRVSCLLNVIFHVENIIIPVRNLTQEGARCHPQQPRQTCGEAGLAALKKRMVYTKTHSVPFSVGFWSTSQL